MRVIVTGGAGFIGSHIVDRLIRDNHTVLVVDDLSTGNLSNLADSPGAEFLEMDMGRPEFVQAAIAFRPDAISHVAAQPSVAISMKHPEQDAATNIVAGLNVMRAAIESKSSQLIYITTGGALYGVPDYLPCDEDHPIRPASAYGLSKWTLERYLGILLPVEVTRKVLRLANIYGPRQDPNGEAGVVSIFADRMIRNLPVEIFGDGEQTRDFVFVEDVAAAHAVALNTAQPLTANISSGTPVSVNELFHVIAQGIGYETDPHYLPQRPGDLRDSVLANDRARRLLGWFPTTSLPEGVETTIGWIRTSEEITPLRA